LLYGAIGVIAAYQGLQEQASLKQAEAEMHYQRGQEHLSNNSLDLAIAEFEMALSLDPRLLEAREALRRTREIVQAQPTATSETRTAAAASILEEAEAQVDEEKWFEATQTLAQIRDLDPNYQVERVAELLFTANYQLGLQLVTPDRVDDALLAFDRALAERPDDPEVAVEQAKAALYVEGKAAEEEDWETAIKAFRQLYEDTPDYLDVEKRLLQAYELLADELAEQEEWCDAETRYLEANRLKPDENLQVKADNSNERCQETTIAQADAEGSPQVTPNVTPARAGSPSSASIAATPGLAPTTAANPAPSGQGSIFFSAFNSNELRWEILAVPVSGGTPRVVALNGTMPSVSPDGRLLVYHSELIDAEGFHRLDLTTGDDARITLYQRHILPRWGSASDRFLFVAQEPGTGRWQVQLGFADGRSDPIILRDGRTPDWSPQNLIAYQGTDPVGNNPGIYLVHFDGGEATRLTTHESDRSPDFSPDGSQLAYMSTKGGNWDIYTISAAGSAPRQLTTSPAQDGLPAWSPDGSQIAYVSDSGGGWAIYVINAEGGTPVKVTAWDGNNLPDWLLAQIWWAR
jgi:tetratricopeptide (TPR) repeat protein